MRSRLISLTLPKTEYEQLCRSAEADERDPVQQARWILKQALAPEQGGQPDLAKQLSAAVQEATA